jgi:poly-gamma-glutamate capsule biosynthesis protein CapA/YwtB (metallophosphatase superfamily)
MARHRKSERVRGVPPIWSLLVAVWVMAGTGCSASDSATHLARTAAIPEPEPARTEAPQPTTEADRSSSTVAPRPTTSAATTMTAASTTEPSGPRRISLAFTGDTLAHSPLWRQAERNAAGAGGTGYDFDPMLAGLAPVIASADLAVCHLETPIAPDGEDFTTFPLFGVPEQIADAIAAAGYDRCSTASNHTVDRGTAGIDRTVDVLESRGLGQSGMARVPAEIEPRVFEVNGIAISHLSYTFSYNGLSLPEGEEWRSAVIDPDRIIDDAIRARDLGAEVVIVSMHWGEEAVHRPTSFQYAVADRITASGAVDLVVGHHAHVVQPIEQVNGTWVLFGLGNVLSNLPTSSRWPAASQDAAAVTVDMTVDERGEVTVGRPVVHPTWVDKDAGWTVLLVDHELARDDISDGQRGRLERSLERTRAVLGDFFTTGDATS